MNTDKLGSLRNQKNSWGPSGFGTFVRQHTIASSVATDLWYALEQQFS